MEQKDFIKLCTTIDTIKEFSTRVRNELKSELLDINDKRDMEILLTITKVAVKMLEELNEND